MYLVLLVHQWSTLDASPYKVKVTANSNGFIEVYDDRGQALDAAGGRECLVLEVEPREKED